MGGGGGVQLLNGTSLSALSKRELEVLALLSWHRSYEETAEILNVALGTIHAQVAHITRKTNMSLNDAKREYIQELINGR